MRKRYLLGLGCLAVAAWLTLPALVEGQFRKGGFGGGMPGGGMPGGGMPGGGFQGGGFRGPGGAPGGFGRGGAMPGGGFMGGDPNRMFDMLARGRPYFLVNDTRSLREPLTKFAQERGISNGQITRELFTQFSQSQAATGARPAFGGFGGAPQAPGGFNPGGFNPGGFAPGGFNPGGFGPGGGFDPSQWADGEFRRRDNNGDNVLNRDEMPDAIREDVGRYDTNRDGLIDQTEYRTYFSARMNRGGNEQDPNPVTIILEEEFDQRPTVYRAGKMPKEPRWLEELDTDRDGQVGLYEWRRGGKDIEDFATYDPNDDGFITAEEALRVYNAQRGTATASSGDRPSWMGGRDGGREGGRDGGRDGGRGGPSFMSRDGGGGGFSGMSKDEIRAKMMEYKRK
jgi:hypothetical protein